MVQMSMQLRTSTILMRWLSASMLLVALCLILAWQQYPKYSMLDHDISFLGHPRLNPTGWWYWSLGMGIAGVMQWPVTTRISRRIEELTSSLSPWLRKLVALGTLSWRAASVGMIGLALIPQYERLITAHQLAGAMAFGGLYATTLFFWCVPLWSTSLSRTKLVAVTFASYWGPVGFLVTQGYRWFAYGEIGRQILVKHQSHLLRFSLWEWMLLACSTSSTIALVLLISEQNRDATIAETPIDIDVTKPVLVAKSTTHDEGVKRRFVESTIGG